MPAVAIISTWRDMGYYMVLFLAGLQAVPRELIDAARVDGAGAAQRFVHVTLPALRPTTFFIIVILTINSLKVFDLILVMTQGGPGTSTLVLSQFIYQQGFVDYKFGYASAASVALFLLSIIFTAVQFALNRRGGAR
jgi:multiple sugar transport system permease protein/alpha-1,4-digalacturonate transport system permease protein